MKFHCKVFEKLATEIYFVNADTICTEKFTKLNSCEKNAKFKISQS